LVSAAAVLLEAARAGVTLRLHRGRVLARPLSAVNGSLAALIRVNKRELVAWLHEREVERLAAAAAAEPENTEVTPAASLIETCQRLGIGLRVDAGGRLVLGRSDLCGHEPGIPASLVMAVEAHAAGIAQLLSDRAPPELPPSTSIEKKRHDLPAAALVEEDPKP
jgi:hypothetical protein